MYEMYVFKNSSWPQKVVRARVFPALKPIHAQPPPSLLLTKINKVNKINIRN